MKKILILFFVTTLLLACNKESVTKTRLKGEWKVDIKQTYWYNGNNTNPPQVFKKANFATITFDKKGKGKFRSNEMYAVPYTDTVWNGGSYQVTTNYKQEYITYDLESDGDALKFIYNNDQGQRVIINWSWDKKSFTLIPSLGMNNKNFNELVYTCYR